MDTTFYAHRGSSHLYSENTRAAYLQALAEGADGIECDVHLSADGIIVCHHDPTVDRTSTSSGRIADLTVDELKGLDFTTVVPGPVPAAFGATNEQLLTLNELIRLVDDAERPVGLAIEIKHPSPFGHLLEKGVLATLAEHGFDPTTGAAGRSGQIAITLMSFEPDSLRHLARRVSTSVLCQLITSVEDDRVTRMLSTGEIGRAAVSDVLRRSMAEGTELIDAGGAGIIGPGVSWVRENEDRVRAWIGRGLRARIWTVDEPADARYLIDLGVDELTSNRPGWLRQEVQERRAD